MEKAEVGVEMGEADMTGKVAGEGTVELAVEATRDGEFAVKHLQTKTAYYWI